MCVVILHASKRKSYDKPRPHLKKQRYYIADKGPSSQSYGFSSSHVWMWELDHKESWAPKQWCFQTVVLGRLLRVPWTARRSKQSIIKEINPEYSLERLMLKLKLQYFGHLMWRIDSLEKTLMLGKTEGRRRGRQRMGWLDAITNSISSVQSLSHVLLLMTPWTAARQASLSITNFQSPPKSMSTELVMPSNYLILCHPLLLLPSIFPSIRVFSNESTLWIRWPKYWSFSFKISPTNEKPGLISFRMDWLDLFAVQGSLKSLLQHHSSKASILLCSAFFIVQLSHPYMTTGKTKALTRQTFVDKVMPLLFNMLSRLVITFLPRSKRLLISWLQSPSAVILEPRKIKSATVSTVSPSICHEVSPSICPSVCPSICQLFDQQVWMLSNIREI